MKTETKNELKNLIACVLTMFALIAFCLINLFIFNA